MNTLAGSEVLKLSISERLKLVEDIWDSIVECPDAVTLTNAQKMELDSRLDEYHRDPKAGSPWSMVREKMLNRQ